VEQLEEVVAGALRFLRHRDELHIRPVLIPLAAGETYEQDAFAVTTCASRHTAPGLVYRFVDRATGAVVAFTGDTAHEPAIARHVREANLLIHDATHGASRAPAADPGLHCGAPEAADIARDAAVRRLALIHGAPARQDAAVAAARAIFPNTFWPRNGETVTVI
jgi:ribonuclease BN (tRNA processing enzyme)